MQYTPLTPAGPPSLRSLREAGCWAGSIGGSVEAWQPGCSTPVLPLLWRLAGCCGFVFCTFPNLPSSSFFQLLGHCWCWHKDFICLFIVQLDHIFPWEKLREAKLLFADMWTVQTTSSEPLCAQIWPRHRGLCSSSAVASAGMGHPHRPLLCWLWSSGGAPGDPASPWSRWTGQCVVWRATERN